MIDWYLYLMVRLARVGEQGTDKLVCIVADTQVQVLMKALL